MKDPLGSFFKPSLEIIINLIEHKTVGLDYFYPKSAVDEFQ